MQVFSTIFEAVKFVFNYHFIDIAKLTVNPIWTRFDGRALLDFIRETGSRRAQKKSEEEEELEEFVNFERYRDLIKHRHRGCRYFFIS